LFDLTITKDLTELIGKNFSFPDIEAIGQYLFKKYCTHSLEDVNQSITISPLNAAKRLVYECELHNRLDDLFCFIIELDGALLNGKRVDIVDLERLLYRLANTGNYFDFNKRKIISYNDQKNKLKNWGALKDGKEYHITIASIDICNNSKLVTKYESAKIEELYFHFWEYIRKKYELYDGRVWSLAGDGCLLAFRNGNGLITGVSCCLEILFSLPIFNSSPFKKISDEISLRIGMDTGMIKFYSDTGRIISDVINYASRIEKIATCPNGFSLSDNIYKELSPAMQKMFPGNLIFDGRAAHTLKFKFSKALC
jgi:class 3 adenylate cyclase